MKKLLIVGKSTLGLVLASLCEEYDTTIVGRPEYDLSQQQDCDRLIAEHEADIIVITHGYLGDNTWNSMMVNFVSPSYLTSNFYAKMNKGQIIIVSSASTQWVSYPGITLGRMMYGVAKEAISNFARHFTRKQYDQQDKVFVQCFEPSRFPSKMNNFMQGAVPIDVAKDLKQMVDNPRLSNVLSLNV